MDTAWAQLHTYTKTYTSSPLSLTRGPHMSSSSSSSPNLSPSRAPGRRVTIAGPSPSSPTSHHRPPPVPYAPPLAPQRHHETAPLLLVVDPCPQRHCRALPSAAATMAAPGSSSSISPETPPFTSPLPPLASQGDDASKQQLFGINPRLEHLLPSSPNLAAVAKFRSA